MLGIPESLALSEDGLRERFYALSKIVHPDRHTHSPPDEARRALRWSALLNGAYRTLRDPASRAWHLLERHGRAAARSTPPLDLAEQWFEIQEEDGAPGHGARLETFLVELRERLAACVRERILLFGEAVSEGMLDRLHASLVREKYLTSLIADVERKKGSL